MITEVEVEDVGTVRRLIAAREEATRPGEGGAQAGLPLKCGKGGQLPHAPNDWFVNLFQWPYEPVSSAQGGDAAEYRVPWCGGCSLLYGADEASVSE